MVENLKVEAYETTLTLKELASLSTPNPSEILIAPWDKEVIPQIEKAVYQGDLGLSPIVEKDQIRLRIPPLSEERRRELAKLVGQKVERGKVAARQVRQKAREEVERLEKESEIGEDEKFRRWKEIEETAKKVSEEIEEIGEGKKKEIMEV